MLNDISEKKLYTSKVIKAGALLPDTKALLSSWDPELSVDENLQRVRRQNLLGKTSRSRVESVLAIFRQRYFAEDSVAQALTHLVQNRFNGDSLERILYFHAMRADSLLYDIVIQLIEGKWSRGAVNIDSREVQSALKKWVKEGKTAGVWSDPTINRVTQGALSTLRDFGVLQGAVNKRIAPVYLPVQAFSYIAFYLKQHQPSGAKVLDLDDWKLFFLTKDGVEHLFLEAHQQSLLEYHAAGSVIRLTFPASTLKEYADVLIKKPN